MPIVLGSIRARFMLMSDDAPQSTSTLPIQEEAIGTHSGVPAVQATWPVAIFGHGFTDNKNNSPFVVAATMAAHGIATIAVNVVGHGFGGKGTLTVSQAGGGSVTIPAGGRGIDLDGNGIIDSTEGVSAVPPRTIISSRDGLRQTVVDLMQLVRVIEVGVDVDGDGVPDLDRNRIYYFGARTVRSDQR